MTSTALEHFVPKCSKRNVARAGITPMMCVQSTTNMYICFLSIKIRKGKVNELERIRAREA